MIHTLMHWVFKYSWLWRPAICVPLFC